MQLFLLSVVFAVVDAEFIQTEKSHYRTLKIMQRVTAAFCLKNMHHVTAKSRSSV